MTKMQEERKARAIAKAEHLSREANRRFDSARDRLAHIPPGQPVLLGHHSEKRHRRDLDRHDNDMRKGFEAKRAADRASSAAVLAGRAILSDDPEALVALREKLAEMEKSRTMSKKINKLWRKGGAEALREAGISKGTILVCETTMKSCSWLKSPLDLKNLGANIRRVKGRIAELEAEAARPETDDIEGDGFTIEEDSADCRIRFHFDTRTDKETHTKMRRAGFVFSRANGAYQRKLNNGGRYAAKRMAKELFGWSES